MGVMAGLELVRTLNDLGYETEAPIEIVAWTNEEGSRFLAGDGRLGGVYRCLRARSGDRNPAASRIGPCSICASK